MLQSEENLNNNEIQSESLLDKKESKRFEVAIWKKIYLFLMGSGGIYFFSFIVSLILLFALGKDQAAILSNFIVYSILFVALMAVVVIDFPKFKSEFKNWKPYVAGIICTVTIIVFEIVYTNIVNLFYKFSVNDNETAVRSIVDLYPVASIFVLGIVGPICEELTYRVGLFNLVKKANVVLAFIVTTIVFAMIHFNFVSKNIWDELVNLPCYLFSGFAFSFVFYYYGFVGSMTAHIGNNLYAVTMQIILKAIKGTNA